MRTKYLLLFLTIFLLLSSVRVVIAENRTLEENGLAITPFLFEEQTEPGKALERTITIANTTNTALPLDISINDFEPVGKNGQVRFLNPDINANPGVSLASWIKITKQPAYTIEPNSSTTLTFTITPPVGLDAGTHYGGLLFSYHTLPESGSNTTIVKKIAALIIVQVGTAKPAANISNFALDKKYYQNPEIHITTNIVNKGNTYLQPKGKVEIRNLFGQIAGLAYINENAQTILPQNTREFTSQFKDPWLLGYYTANATIWYGSNPKLESHAKASFWVFPIRNMAIILSFLLLAYLLLKAYNHWIIKHSKG